MRPSQVRKITRDLALTFFSIILAFILVRVGLIDQLIENTRAYEFLTEFVAGIFFTSTFTTPLAVATFLTLGQEGFNPYLTAAIGASGAVLGDLLIFRFVKDDLTADLLMVGKGLRRTFIGKILKSKLFYWLTPVVAALIIASPLPDEIGVSLLGIDRINTRLFVLLSYSFNFMGILLILLLGQAIF